MIADIEVYLRENIDDNILILPWGKRNDLPLFLRNSYNFYEIKLLETQLLLMEVLDLQVSLDQLEKQLKQVKNVANRDIVLLYKEISRYKRKKLIDSKIAFLIEGGQMYMPFLALDLKKAEKHIVRKIKRFSIPAQVAYLHFLYNKDDVVNINALSEKLRFNKMTASRALNELYDTNLITYQTGGRTGRSKEYKRIPDPDYFKGGQEYLKTPVKKLVYTKTIPLGALTAGLDALAVLTMINPPRNRVVAIDRNQLKSEKIEIIKDSELIKDQDLIEVEVWDYDPRQFASMRQVDLVSLYASLKEEADERVEQALQEALRGEPWYMD
jgi:DNA-binding transcriptional regulator YhcF (GntR family)